MYSGTTLRHGSGRIVGVHQRIDRLARKHVKRYLPSGTHFPSATDILYFEGNNGPDGIKRKSPSKDEPWHYIDPKDPEDTGLLKLIDDHIYNLSQALKQQDHERAAFEAAWMAHAVVDGLTPAHHYPLDDKIEELWGKPHTERVSVRDKTIIRGNSHLDTLSKNWQYWGAKGVFTAHVAFEWGVATAIAGDRSNRGAPRPADIKRVENEGFMAIFEEQLHAIANMDMYDEFIRDNWTHDLAEKTRKILVPAITRTVALGWYYAAYQAKGKKK